MPRKKPKRPTKASIKRAADRAEAISRGDEIDDAAEPTALEPPVVTTKSKGGRPTAYKKEYARIAAVMCNNGATDMELAQAFGVDTSTIWRWQSRHPAFCKALKAEKTAYDDRVVRSLAQRAIGYRYNAEKIFSHQGTITRAPYVEHVPPDPSAAKMWLSARKAKEWGELKRLEVSGPDGGAIELSTDRERLELARWIAFQLRLGQDAMTVISGEADETE